MQYYLFGLHFMRPESLAIKQELFCTILVICLFVVEIKIVWILSVIMPWLFPLDVYTNTYMYIPLLEGTETF